MLSRLLQQETGHKCLKPYREEDFLQDSIRRQLNDLKVSVNLDAVMDLLVQEKVITVSQHDQLCANQKAEGMVYAVGRLLEWVLLGEVEVKQFIAIVQMKLPWISSKIKHGV